MYTGLNGDYHDIDDMSILIIIQAGHNDAGHTDDENHHIDDTSILVMIMMIIPIIGNIDNCDH